jgi:hypothetical protein
VKEVVRPPRVAETTVDVDELAGGRHRGTLAGRAALADVRLVAGPVFLGEPAVVFLASVPAGRVGRDRRVACCVYAASSIEARRSTPARSASASSSVGGTLERLASSSCGRVYQSRNDSVVGRRREESQRPAARQLDARE